MYDDREQPAELLFYDARGRLLSRVEFVCDRDGNLIEEAQTRAPEMLPPEMFTALNEAQLQTVRALFGAGPEPTRRQHRYDEQGRRTETRFTTAMGIRARKVSSRSNATTTSTTKDVCRMLPPGKARAGPRHVSDTNTTPTATG